MAQVLTLRPPQRGRVPTLPRRVAPRGPSTYLAELRNIAAEEAPMAVEFGGLTDAQKLVAIKGFPGGRRFTLGPPSQRVSS
jgi:hypothetical protein